MEDRTHVAAMGDDPLVTAVLLTASDATARQRLAGREIGTALDHHFARSDRAARELDALSPASVHRVRTDDRTVTAVARGHRSGWVVTAATADSRSG